MTNNKSENIPAGHWRSICHNGSSSSPSARVGHTAHAIQSNDVVRPDSIVILGGANPDGTLDEVFLFSVTCETWTRISCTPNSPKNASLARYEHSSGLLKDGEFLIFGGATQSNPLSDLLKLRIVDDPSAEVSSHGPFISIGSSSSKFPGESRTQHGSACLTEHDQLLVFAGGAVGNEPVSDQQVYLYNSEEDSWASVSTVGDGPCNRFGHVLLYQYPLKSALEKESVAKLPRGSLLIHGGMAKEEFFEDFYQLSFEEDNQGNFCGYWKRYSQQPKSDLSGAISPSGGLLYQTGHIPDARAAHGGVILSDPEELTFTAKLFIFGGVSPKGALNDLYCFDTGTNQWTEINIQGPVPRPRCDFACCLYTRTSYDELNGADAGALTKQYCFFIHGGMDTEGNLFDDTWTIVLAEKSYPKGSPVTCLVNGSMKLSIGGDS